MSTNNQVLLSSKVNFPSPVPGLFGYPEKKARNGALGKLTYRIYGNARQSAISNNEEKQVLTRCFGNEKYGNRSTPQTPDYVVQRGQASHIIAGN